MICDVCREREATLFDRVVENGKSVEYAYCKACYSAVLKSGQSPKDVARERIARIGKECRVCGHTAERLEDTLFLGCPDCYREMRGVVENLVCEAQVGNSYQANSACDNDALHIFSDSSGRADRIGENDSALSSVVSSRIRLARSVEGMKFTQYIL